MLRVAGYRSHRILYCYAMLKVMPDSTSYPVTTDCRGDVLDSGFCDQRVRRAQ